MKFRFSVFRKAKKGCFRKQTKMKYRLKDWLYKVNNPTFKISVVHDVFRIIRRPRIIAHCRNVRSLERVSYIDYIENLNISTEMLMNKNLPNQV